MQPTNIAKIQGTQQKGGLKQTVNMHMFQVVDHVPAFKLRVSSKWLKSAIRWKINTNMYKIHVSN